MQGLPAAPQIVADQARIDLANFENEAERDARRRAGTASGAVGGALHAGMTAMGHIGPICLVLPPLCLGVAALGGAAGGSQATVTTVSAEDASRLRQMFREHATSSALQQQTVHGMPAADPGSAKLVVRLVGVLLVPRTDGVSFRLVAQAQGFPDSDRQWQPTMHFVPFPTRPIADWLKSDGAQLKSDLESALASLSQSIAPAYRPYRPRFVDAYPHQAIVYIYRPYVQFNWGGYPEILINGEGRFPLKVRGNRAFFLSPGEYEIKAEGNSTWYPPDAMRTLSVEAGGEYFVRVTPSARPMPSTSDAALQPEGGNSERVQPFALFLPGRMGRTVITLVPRAQARMEISQTRPITD